MLNKKNSVTNKSVAYKGAVIGVAAVFAYSLLVMVYAIIRSSVTIYNIMPREGGSDVLLANGFSIAYSVIVFSLLMALVSSLAGTVAGVILKKALQYYNPNFILKRAIAVSCVTAFGTLAFVYFLMFVLLKKWMTFNYIETFSFWFLIPAVIYIGVCIVGGVKLNRSFNIINDNRMTT